MRLFNLQKEDYFGLKGSSVAFKLMADILLGVIIMIKNIKFTITIATIFLGSLVAITLITLTFFSGLNYNTNNLYSYLAVKNGDYIYDSLITQMINFNEKGEINEIAFNDSNIRINEWISSYDRTINKNKKIEIEQQNIEYRDKALELWSKYYASPNLFESNIEFDIQIAIFELKKMSKISDNLNIIEKAEKCIER